MMIIPAIDIRGGKVVRLMQGQAEKETVYSDSPVETAKRWAGFGAKLIHVVDLDGALQGALKNLDIIKKMVKAVKSKIEIGGGVRDISTVEKALDAGIEKVCIGTKALDKNFLAAISKSRFRDRVVISIDAKDGLVCAQGWIELTCVKAIDLAREALKSGVRTVEYTDISRDGMLEGPNMESLKEILTVSGINVIAAGGITTIGDVRRLKALEKDGLKGMVIGKALYEGRIDLGEAMKAC